jgi:hypothetical protein
LRTSSQALAVASTFDSIDFAQSSGTRRCSTAS